jgi:hypothetical protein
VLSPGREDKRSLLADRADAYALMMKSRLAVTASTGSR